MANLLQPGADCDLFVAGERGTHDGEVISPLRYPPDSLIDGKNKISGVPSLSQDICTRTQGGDVTAYREYSVQRRIVGASNH